MPQPLQNPSSYPVSQNQIYVVVIGVGIAFAQEVADVGNKTLFIKDFQELQNIFDSISCKGHSPPSVSLRARGATSATVELAFLEPYSKFEVEIFKENSNSWKPGGTTTGRVCFVGDLEPGTTYLVRARAYLKNGKVTDWSTEEENAKEMRFRTIYGTVMIQCVQADPFSSVELKHTQMRSISRTLGFRTRCKHWPASLTTYRSRGYGEHKELELTTSC